MAIWVVVKSGSALVGQGCLPSGDCVIVGPLSCSGTIFPCQQGCFIIGRGILSGKKVDLYQAGGRCFRKVGAEP